jgi:hypothetical protein
MLPSSSPAPPPPAPPSHRDRRLARESRHVAPLAALLIAVLAVAAPGRAQEPAAGEEPTEETRSAAEPPPAAEADSDGVEEPAADAEADGADPLADRHRDWLDQAAPFITNAERAAFLALKRDYQRDAFIERFWREHDPYPQTARNELRERFTERIELIRSAYGTFEDDRAARPRRCSPGRGNP